MKVIAFTGGRDFSDLEMFEHVFRNLRSRHGDFLAAHGGASGLDKMVRQSCLSMGWPCVEMPAPWGFHGPAAGPIRNGWILRYLSPELLVAFPGGKGTADMVRQAIALGIKVQMGTR